MTQHLGTSLRTGLSLRSLRIVKAPHEVGGPEIASSKVCATQMTVKVDCYWDDCRLRLPFDQKLLIRNQVQTRMSKYRRVVFPRHRSVLSSPGRVDRVCMRRPVQQYCLLSVQGLVFQLVIEKYS